MIEHVFGSRLLPLGVALLVLVLAVLGTARMTSGAAPETRSVADPGGDPVRGWVAGMLAGGAVGETYLVKLGDTLWEIAVEHYGGDPREAVWRIQDRNRLDDPLITPGQVLVLP